jgi:hypothetical protein
VDATGDIASGREIVERRKWTRVSSMTRDEPALLDDAAVEPIFEELADLWEQETAFESVVTRKATHPAYQRIIGLGPQAVPLILRRLAQEPRQWFWALTAITGENPAEALTGAEEAAEAWLRWGRERGITVE